MDAQTSAIVAASIAVTSEAPRLTLVEGGAGKVSNSGPIRIHSDLGAKELAHELRMQRLYPGGLPDWMKEQMEADAAKIDAAFGEERFVRWDDGKGRRLSCTDLREGVRVWCPDGLKGYGRLAEADSIAPGSFGTVAKVRGDYSATVEFADAETGELKFVDCTSTDLRWPPEDDGGGWAA